MKFCVRSDACGNDRARLVSFCKGAGEEAICGIPQLPETVGPDGRVSAERLREYQGLLRRGGISLRLITESFFNEDLDSDAAVERRVDGVLAALSAMQAADVESMFLFVGATFASPKEREMRWERLAAAYARIVPHAEKTGRKIATHGMQMPDYLLFSAADLQKLIEVAPRPCSGLTFCVGCFRIAGNDLMEWLDRFGPERVFMVHMRDVRFPPGGGFEDVRYGEGVIDLPGIAARLTDIGFTGLVCPEHVPRFPGDPFEELSTAWGLGYLRALFARAAARSR
jgi:sugar phosphate isomerase/epimerase